MNGTPRLRSAFPTSPNQSGSGQKSKYQNASASGALGSQAPRSFSAVSQDKASAPLIPFDVLDAPSQRLYLIFFYLGLTIWRLYDYVILVSDESDSLWLFMKWVAIDSIFLYGLPALKIPWLQWSSPTTSILFVAHAMLSAVLMFRIPLPFGSWFIAIVKLLYDRELAITEIHVKPASVLHNSSLILGKQIIHILPEGSAVLNPDQKSFCIDDTNSPVHLPININQTNPISIELLRIDLSTNINETITIAGKELQRLKMQANKAITKNDKFSPRDLMFPTKKSGLYRLQRVVDESKLDVRRRLLDTLVVQCPSAKILSVPKEKCKGDLSDFYLEVNATPPFKIKYSKIVNQEDNGHVVLSIHPENLIPPLSRQPETRALVSSDSETIDVSWARTQSIKVPLNESLGVGGVWEYLIDEIHDAYGNTADYNSLSQAKKSFREFRRENQQEQTFVVHERPKIALDGYGPENPLMVPKGQSQILPLQLTSSGYSKLEDTPHVLSYSFLPVNEMAPNQENVEDILLKQVTIHSNDHGFQLNEPGLYTLKSVRSQYCVGEVLEPSTTLLVNPPQPDMETTSENIPDKCAGNSVGLIVDLNLIGTPPFRIDYDIRRAEGTITPRTVEINHNHWQLEFRPSHAGHYTYEFTRISDAVYKNPRSLKSRKLIFKQDVKPSASALFSQDKSVRMACLGEPVSIPVYLHGEPPWNLDYDIVHNGQGQKFQAQDITNSVYSLTTGKLMTGGDYFLILKSITDKSGCKVLLDQDTKIEVRHQKPRASFGQIDGQQSILALEGRKISLPLKLQGEQPWVLAYRNLDNLGSTVAEKTLHHENDNIDVDAQGTYEIVNIRDASCPGSVGTAANKFNVRWIPRPTIKLAEGSTVEFIGDKYIKKDNCEGDEDAVDISFTGSPPFTIEYNQKFKPFHGAQSKKLQHVTSGLNSASVRMETFKAGLYEYEFFRLGDSSYSQAARGSVLNVQQRVHPRPTARFSEGGKTYKYCKEEESNDEVIPIIFAGLAPFYVEIEIRHHTTSKPERVKIPNVETSQYNFRISHKYLSLGTHAVTIRKVRDARGCQQKMDFNAPHVQVSVADVPSISPLEASTDFCVGDRISYSLSGTPPFNVFYTFQGLDSKATVQSTTFKRLAEKPGEFKITAISDQKSTNTCKARTSITKIIHEMPSVRISKGKTATVDIHEGGEAEILFEFGGTPPFEFTYTRSTNPSKGKKTELLETKNEISYDYTKTIRASDEGVYEVVSIKDYFCAFSMQKARKKSTGQKLLGFG